MIPRLRLYPTFLVADTCTSAPCSRSSVTIAACPAQGIRFGVWGFRLGVRGLRFGVWGLRFSVWALRFWVWGVDVWSAGFEVRGVGFRIQISILESRVWD